VSIESRTPATAQRVGVIGLGVMGAPMARNILARGFPLAVFSRSPGPVERLVTEGARAAATAGEAAATSDVLIVTVPDTPDLAAVMEGPDGVLSGAQAGLIVVDCGSHDPTTMPGLATALRERGADLLDAPLSGGEAGALAGSLSIMVGGEAAVLERARPVLEAVGSTIVHVGAIGAGQVAKAANQLVVAAAIEALAEAFILARASGIDAARLFEALAGGLAASRVLELNGPRMLTGDYTPGGKARFHLKDLRNARAVAAAHGLDLPTLDLVTTAFDRLVEAGRGDLDHSALLTLLEDA
jgi:2-hydroxy-3-oxopropionate reductase